jgi:hypothetical protein
MAESLFSPALRLPASFPLIQFLVLAFSAVSVPKVNLPRLNPIEIGCMPEGSAVTVKYSRCRLACEGREQTSMSEVH